MIVLIGLFTLGLFTVLVSPALSPPKTAESVVPVAEAEKGERAVSSPSR